MGSQCEAHDIMGSHHRSKTMDVGLYMYALARKMSVAHSFIAQANQTSRFTQHTLSEDPAPF